LYSKYFFFVYLTSNN